MESHGEVGKIQVTENVMHRLSRHEEYVFERRPKVHVKGKGSMDTYFLSGKESHHQVSALAPPM